MKLTTRGFTLVELMIVIAIIGILAAALFPSLTAYLRRGRDAARVSHLKDASNAIGAYYSDNERFPLSTSSGCLNSGSLSATYLAAFPIDPSSGHWNGCTTASQYGYASGTGASFSPQFIISAIFENDNGGNYSNVAGTEVETLIGTGEFSFSERTSLDVPGIVRKGNGSGYIIYK